MTPIHITKSDFIDSTHYSKWWWNFLTDEIFFIVNSSESLYILIRSPMCTSNKNRVPTPSILVEPSCHLIVPKTQVNTDETDKHQLTTN